MNGLEPVVAFDGVRYDRAGRTILEDVTFTIGSHEFVGIIGGNGAGKTTLLRLMLGQLRASAGRIRVLGHPVGRANRGVGYVPQKIAVDPDVPLRGRDFVGLGIDGERWGLPLPSRAKRERVDRALREVDATPFADAPIGRLSGGEQQRLAIAQAIVGEPRLLLLDEPLANLDITGSDDVVTLVSHLKEEHGMSVLMVAHDINPLLPALDRVLYIARGRIAIGNVSDVVNADVLGQLYGAPVDVLTVRDRIIVLTGSQDEHAEAHAHAHERAS